MNIRNYFLVLFACLCWSSPQLNAQGSSFYTVLVGNYPEPQRQEFSLLSRYGFIYSVDVNQNLSKVYIGGFDNEKEARELVNNIKAMYPSAQVEKIKADPTDEAIVIQVATRVFNQEIEWPKYEQLENIFALLNGDKVKVVTGIYPSMEAARNDLKEIRAGAFNDAFVKIVSRNHLIELNGFETGIKEPLIPIKLDGKRVAAKNGGNPISRPVSNSKRPANNPNPRGYESVIPKSPYGNGQPSMYDNDIVANPNIGVKGGDMNSGNVSRPEINSKIKRRSALELQKVLKSYGTYNGSLDGYYGPGTTSGYEAILQQNSDLQKYVILSQYQVGDSQDQRPLQQSINTLLEDPNATATIDGSNEAIAKAYQAYSLFNSLGPSNDVNLLMNEAIQQAYANMKTQVNAPFDYSATYAYNDWDQLVLHLHYIHGAPGNTYSAPCWLIKRHPAVSAEAQAAFAEIGSNSYLVQNCDEFMQWEEIKLLKAISNDMNAGQQGNPSASANQSSQRAQLYMTTAPLNNTNQQIYESWNRDLWTGLSGWATVDPLHKKMVDVLRVAYFQSQARLEDYYMSKGFNYDQAVGLSLATLKTVVGNDLQRFI